MKQSRLPSDRRRPLTDLLPSSLRGVIHGSMPSCIRALSDCSYQREVDTHPPLSGLCRSMDVDIWEVSLWGTWTGIR
jgi:hypothetical protein